MIPFFTGEYDKKEVTTMCGRYTLASAEDLSDFEDIINEIQRSERQEKISCKGISTLPIWLPC